VAVIEYTVAEVGETTMEVPVDPVLQEYVPPPDAVSVSLWPVQMVPVVPLITAVMVETPTVKPAVLVHPLAPVTVTEYPELAVGLTVIADPVLPVFHR
jgi:hypothetical protein